jgi:hypothetical protein
VAQNSILEEEMDEDETRVPPFLSISFLILNPGPYFFICGQEFNTKREDG